MMTFTTAAGHMGSVTSGAQLNTASNQSHMLANQRRIQVCDKSLFLSAVYEEDI